MHFSKVVTTAASMASVASAMPQAESTSTTTMIVAAVETSAPAITAGSATVTVTANASSTSTWSIPPGQSDPIRFSHGDFSPRAWIDWHGHWFKLYGAHWKVDPYVSQRALEEDIQHSCGKVHMPSYHTDGPHLDDGGAGWEFYFKAKMNRHADQQCLVDFIQAGCPGCDGNDNGRAGKDS